MISQSTTSDKHKLEWTSIWALPDAELVLMAQNRNSAAFDVLVRRHQRAVHNLLYQFAPYAHNTSDLCQEVFIRAWRRIGSLRNPKAFRSWTNQIAANLFYDDLRRRPKLMIISMDESPDSDYDDSPTRDIPDYSELPDECVQRKELQQKIEQAMAQLPQQFQQAIVLREVNGLSYEEIALLTGSEMGTVKSRIARARSKIQRLLAPYVMAA